MPWVRGFDDLIKLTPVFSAAVPFDSRKPAPPEILVDIYLDGRLEQAAVSLSDCFEDPQEYALAHADLMFSGEHRYGGGAQPIFDLRRCR